jgi:hypothetical protein
MPLLIWTNGGRGLPDLVIISISEAKDSPKRQKNLRKHTENLII